LHHFDKKGATGVAYKDKKLEDLANDGFLSLRIGIPTTRIGVEDEADDAVAISVIAAKTVKKNYLDQNALESIKVTKRFTEDQRNDEYFTQEGDIIVKLSTPYECAMVRKPSEEKLLISSACLRIRVTFQGRSVIDPKYLVCYLTTRLGEEALRDIAKQAQRKPGIGVINKRYLCDLKVPLPSLEEQHEVTRIFDQVLNGIEYANREIETLEKIQESAFLTIINREKDTSHEAHQ
jgi:restriction endonuclease S subunit